MITWSGPSAKIAVALLALLCVTGAGKAIAQQSPESLRLSALLNQSEYAAAAYRPGVSWLSPIAVPAQTELKYLLLSEYARHESRGATLASDPFYRMLEGLPVTGRVVLSSADGRWTEVHPARDPLLASGDVVVLPRRPDTVSVVLPDGRICRPKHQSGVEAISYALACIPSLVRRVDWVWIAQPDGRVQRAGVASWNEQMQSEPAPGAWIWAPDRSSGWTGRFSERLAAFLATQGPAPEAGGSQCSVRIRNGGSHDVSCEPSRSVGVQEVSPPEGTARIERARDGVRVTSSDFGNAGVMQTPSARMYRAGHFAFNLSRVYPYTYGNVFTQPIDWLEVGFRYINLSNSLYGPLDFSGTQAYKDKSFDIKVRLIEESSFAPALAVGLRDASGTGLFSGEYLVASKRIGQFDLSVGLGWGYLGGRGNLRNPLSSLLGSKFNTRVNNVGQGGSFSFGNYFHGPASVFGGVQYQTPWDKWLVKLEYDGNGYQREPRGTTLAQGSPWNLGVVYKAAEGADVTVGVERGNTVMFGLTLRTDLDRLAVPKLSDPPKIPVSPIVSDGIPNWQMTIRDIGIQTGWHVSRIAMVGSELHVQVEDADAVYIQDRIERASAVLHRDAPSRVARFVFVQRHAGTEMSWQVVDRSAWLGEKFALLAPSAGSGTFMSLPPRHTRTEEIAATNPLKAFEGGVGFSYQHTLGGPEGFILYQLGASGRAKLRIRDDTWIDGQVRLGLVSNYDKFRYTGPSNLPRVRTFLREFATTSKLTLATLQANHVGRIGDNQYFSLYGGYLEEMFGGVGGEWLYRPHASRLAFGIDINAVRQRDFHQNLDFRDYKVVTGHAVTYWDTGWQGVQATLAVGRYLAKDIGATLILTRTFDNGVSVGAFATKTNVSAETFGEGSFDKGVYISIPFDAFLTRSSNSNALLVWKPLTRDGGAMLSRQTTLYGLTNSRSERAFNTKVARPGNDSVVPSDRKENWEPTSVPASPVNVPRVSVGEWKQGGDGMRALERALYVAGYRDVQLDLDHSSRLNLQLSQDQVFPASIAVGRAARIALRLGPRDMRELRVAFTVRGMPGVTYEFSDLNRLERFFRADLSKVELSEYVSISYADPSLREHDPLAKLDGVADNSERLRLTTALPAVLSVARVSEDVVSAGNAAAKIDWIRAGSWGAGLTLASAVFDKRAFAYSRDHLTGKWATRSISAGNALPWLGLAGAAVLALDGSDPVRSRTAVAATEAGASGILLATGLKYLVGRARPDQGLGNASFKPFASNGHDSFPSRHAITAWAVATPFAREYDAPWLYGVAAMSNLSRVAGGKHWISDTVASAALGYGLGMLFWEANSSSRAKGEPRVMVNPSGVKLSWEFQ
jgi:membrane-associated phospholipid phosphatase